MWYLYYRVYESALWYPYIMVPTKWYNTVFCMKQNILILTGEIELCKIKAADNECCMNGHFRTQVWSCASCAFIVAACDNFTRSNRALWWILTLWYPRDDITKCSAWNRTFYLQRWNRTVKTDNDDTEHCMNSQRASKLRNHMSRRSDKCFFHGLS